MNDIFLISSISPKQGFFWQSENISKFFTNGMGFRQIFFLIIIQTYLENIKIVCIKDK
jgi:hypothetical protein